MDNTTKHLLWIVPLLLGLSWLAVGWWGRPIGDFGVETDFYGDFVVYARQWMAGEPGAMNGYRGPFYYLLLGVLERGLGDAFTVAKILSSVAAAASLLLLGHLWNRLFDGTVALTGLLFLAASPIYAMYAFRASTDMVFFALYCLTLYFLLATRGRRRDWILAGALAGCAVLTRYNGFALLPAGLAVAFLTVRPAGAAARRATAFVAAWLVVAAPWFGYLWRTKGNPFWSNAFQNTAMDVYTSDPSVAVGGDFTSRVAFHSLLDVVRLDPSRFVAAMTRNLGTHFSRDVTELVGWGWALGALAGVAIWIARNRPKEFAGTDARDQRKRIAFFLVGVIVYLSLVPVFYNPRFMIPLLPFWAAGAGLFVVEVAALVRRRFGTRVPVAALVLVGIAVLGIATQAREFRRATDRDQPQSPPLEILRIAEQARASGARFGPDTPIAARKPHIGYYLGAPVVRVDKTATPTRPDAPGAEYLLVTATEAGWAAALAPLLTGQDVPTNLQVVASSFSSDGAGRMRGGTLYRIVSRPAAEGAPGELAPASDGSGDLDQLRLDLARWTLAFDPLQPVQPLLDAVADQEDPAVVDLRGDLAFYERDPASAREFYARVITDSTRLHPTAQQVERAMLRLAAVAAVQGDAVGVRGAFGEFLRRRDPEAAIGDREFWQLTTELGSDLEYVPLVGLLAGGLELRPRSGEIGRLYGKLLMTTGWTEQARPLLEACLRARPTDTEIRGLLENPPARRPR